MTKYMAKKPCKIKHDYQLVGNRYKNGKPVTEGGKWVTEKRCKKCDCLAPKLDKVNL